VRLRVCTGNCQVGPGNCTPNRSQNRTKTSPFIRFVLQHEGRHLRLSLRCPFYRYAAPMYLIQTKVDGPQLQVGEAIFTAQAQLQLADVARLFCLGFVPSRLPLRQLVPSAR
jgi:hypothetical protein